MNSKRRALIDACVLARHRETDLLLHLATAGLFEPLWTDQIMMETDHVLLRRLNWPEHIVESRRQAMSDHFAEAWVVGHEELIDGMGNHPKDRHVLAAAVRGNAGWIITRNLKHFPENVLKPLGIRAIEPAEYVMHLKTLWPSETQRIVLERAVEKQMEGKEYLARIGPEFQDLFV